EATIERGGIGVKASLKAFGAAYAKAQGAAEQGDGSAQPAVAEAAEPTPPSSNEPALRTLIERVQRDFPPMLHARLYQGLRRLVDYQDPAYASLYLERLHALQAQTGPDGSEVLHETARHLALWMSYEDTPRVADLKTRASRFERVRAESQAGEQMLHIHEFMHPRLQEVCETLPAPAGRWLMQSGLPRRIVERLTRKGRVVHTNSLRGYLLLRAVAWAARWRQRTTRYERENAMIEDWLARIAAAACAQPELALEIARCQNLVKGYSDTHERGQRNYRTLMQAIDAAQAQGSLTPALLQSWRKDALADEHGHKLREALAASGIATVQPATEETHHV
ncbi:MAG: indolepyruvate oxidoreductase subunit beta family protein, partial [Comamonadaceae bacterium]|nr:indolepyruvate oxidoreductase subunit beta family protein [Comamonadaceae bacterium]